MEKLPLPSELRLENYTPRIQKAIFDRLDLVVDFRPGSEGVGATVKGFIDAIAKHDAIVQKLEEAIKHVEEMKKIYRKCNRLFRNLDSAWNVLMTNQVEFAEYNELRPKMQNIEDRLNRIDDPVIKAKLMTQRDRYLELEPKCAKQVVIYDAFQHARKERDIAVRNLLDAENVLREAKEQEKIQASLISDDHVLADESRKTLTSLFANVHVGFLLHSVNGERMDKLPYDEVTKRIRRLKPPHKTEFIRYDYRFDPFTGVWTSVQDLRRMGVCIEDPLLQRTSFINLAAQGIKKGVQEIIRLGEDPNCTDLTGNTAIVAAAVNGYAEIVEMLVKAGANIDTRDRNMMTPLLYCVNRGMLEMVRLLIDLGADKTYCDHNMRGCVFYAVLSGSLQMVKMFLKKDQINRTDRLWGFTPLHLAASLGYLKMIDLLLERGCSIFRLDRKQRTAEQVAEDSNHLLVHERLIEERLNAPGQVIFSPNEDQSIQFWVGDVEVLDAVWCSDAELTHILYFQPAGESLPSHAGWLKKEKQIKFRPLPMHVTDEDGDIYDNWEDLQAHIGEVQTFVTQALQDIHDANARAQIEAEGNMSQRQLQYSAADDSDAEESKFETANSVTGDASTGTGIVSDLVSRVPRRRMKFIFCDDTGASLAPAMLTIILMLQYQHRAKETISKLQQLRPRVEIGRTILRGIDLLQQTLDQKVLKRMNERLRGSSANSIAF